MLPLWIIDLREKSFRRDFFMSLVGKIDHVHVANLAADSCNQQKFDTQSKIEGNYWRYSCMEDYYYGICIDSSNNQEIRSRYDADHVVSEVEEQYTPEGTANRLYKFQSDLVKEGQAFVNDLRKSNASPAIKINVVVLGDLTEDFTRIVFPSIARMIQKEKGRILPHHIHQGLEILGMLYVPTNINTKPVAIRKSMQRTLKEIDVQYRVNDMRGYDHMMIYQDVQNRTESFYPMLDAEQLAQYLFQCIAHLYLACDETHPLLSGTTAADNFYFSMGATSLYYDSENECIKAQNNLAHEFIKHLKSKGVDEKNNDLSLLSEDDYSPEKIIQDFSVLGKIDDNIIKIKDPSPHPYRNYLVRNLKRHYYGVYLKYFSKNLMQEIHAMVESSTKEALEEVSVKSKKRFSDIQGKFRDNLTKLLGVLSANDGGIPTVERLFKELQVRISKRKQDIPYLLKEEYWLCIEDKMIGNELKDKFQEYHEAYLTDVKNKSDAKQQLKIKKEIVNDLNGLLSNESTLLSMIGRGAIFAIMLVLAAVPVLCLISPHVINLGNVRRFSEVWSMIIFLVPIAIMMVKYWRYQGLKNRLVNNLKAVYLHDAYARVANRMESEIISYYDKLIELSGRYIERCDQIIKEIGSGYEDENVKKLLFPTTMFNQPLIGGKYGNEEIVSSKESDDVEIRINFIRYKFKDLTPIEHFLFINQNKEIVKELFSDVRITENLIRRVNESGESELVTKSQQEEELAVLWDDHKTQFYNKLKGIIKDSVKIYENQTIGEKIMLFTHTYGQDLLKSSIDYAATNGELVSSSDQEYVDTKINDKRVGELITPYLASSIQQFQSDSEHEIYSKYYFITRWRCFDKLILNRILPTEDFDKKDFDKKVVEKDNPKEEYSPRPSSLLLWSLSQFDTSTEWCRLFDSKYFEKAYEEKQIYREIMNQND